MTTFGDFCSGGGGFAVGARAAGAEVVFGVEIDADIAAVYKTNLGDHVLCQPLETVDMAALPYVDHVHISPPCQQFSVARSKTLESRKDGDVGILILDYVAIHSPRLVTLENVPPYANAPVFHAILAGLHTLGYRTQWSIENAANFGVAQTRKRLIMRAVREGETLLPLMPTHAKDPEPAGLFGPALLPWNGWYGAIEDILDTLPESQFAEWQLKRLPAELTTLLMESKFQGRNAKQMYKEVQSPWDTVTALDPNWKSLLIGGANTSDTQAAPGVGEGHAHAPTRCVATNAGSWKALLIEGDAAGDRPPTCGTSAEPAFTLKTDGGGRVHRALLVTDTSKNNGTTVGVRDADSPAQTIDTRPASKTRAFLVEQQNGSHAVPTLRVGTEPAFTTTVHSVKHPAPRAALEQGRVVSMTPRPLARFMSFPDTYILPASRSLASKIIGNAVPPLLAQAICETLPGMGV